ncbi:hypothetical protein [Prochlorothrix hollandica]|uniref:hypothetical protein n=1 Tax=Prochlorothrix hollandica TaxID=1223 RepID=UPI000348037F|nr:hypothetical protein [Prochlorothrix hollandica]
MALLKILFGEIVEPVAQRSPDIATHLAQINLRLKLGGLGLQVEQWGQRLSLQ